ncbi:hypothetical protein [Bacillus sp. 165]|uniref:hypothetical protein n=1 Tax=Bacillus sp. 165 TaxID=1529117 RepID=UPI001ADBCDC5|nr:hypothetical protein [Bacillus sp. 165]MBO9128385.1 hypothetical protein [Bacillus sp. 165]
MLLKKLFFSSNKDDKYRKLEQKLRVLELEIQKLQLLEKKQEEDTIQPPVVIERVHVDKIVFDKFELNNNFGQLGIKELKGKLNIGATYGSDFSKSEEEEEEQEQKEQEKKKPEKPIEKGPKVNIQARKGNIT